MAFTGRSKPTIHREEAAQLYRHIIDIVRNRRDDLQLTQKALADKIGIATATIGHLESQAHTPGLDILLAVCSGLELPVSAVLREAEERCHRAEMWKKYQDTSSHLTG